MGDMGGSVAGKRNQSVGTEAGVAARRSFTALRGRRMMARHHETGSMEAIFSDGSLPIQARGRLEASALDGPMAPTTSIIGML